MDDTYFAMRSFIDEFFESEEAFHEFALWAWGAGYDKEKLSKTPFLWNKLHGKKLKISKKDEMFPSMLKMIEIWKKEKNRM